MLEIIQEGEVSPSAEQVAERADVGLRTVFRHFSDMDSLYSEMSEVIEVEMQAAVERPFKSADARERVVELVARRAAVFEKIAPFKRASDALRHRSRFLEAGSERLAAALRAILVRELPPQTDPLMIESLDLLLSWESWARLRREQALTAVKARQVLEAAVRRLLT